MKNEYTQGQIAEAIEYWKGKLAVREADMPVPEEPINEVNFAGKVGSAIGKAFKGGGGAAATVGKAIASTLFKNDSVKKFVKIMADNQKNKGKGSYYEENDMIFAVAIGKKFYNVVDVEFIKKFWTKQFSPSIGLLADFSKPASKSGDKFTVADFREAAKKAGDKPSQITNTYGSFLLANAIKAAAKDAATSEDTPVPGDLSEAESADTPELGLAGRSPEGYALYLQNPFARVYAAKGWIIFEFDITKKEKQEIADETWG